MIHIPSLHLHSECLNGEITCFNTYTPDKNGELTEEQVEQLKDELVQLFYFQYKHNEHLMIDIRHVHKNPTISKLI